MKTSKFLLLTSLAVLPAWAMAAGEARTIARADVVFFEPHRFTDVKDRHMGDYERTTYLDQIRDHLLDRAKYYVPEGHQLSVTFTDIDMAGDFEPWRGHRWDEVRVVKEIYPPRMVFNFRLTDAAGNVVKEGRRDLRDTSFMMGASTSSANDSVRYEKAMIDNWLRDEFPRVRKN